MTINWSDIEHKWRNKWDVESLHNTNIDNDKPKFFLTVAYPYPNSPQHIGHGRTYTLTDVYARYKRMLGFNVLFPMAFHYTGTPILAMTKRLAENDPELINAFQDVYNIPMSTIKELDEPIKIAQYFHNEIKQGMIEMGYSIDWRREFTTIDKAYSRFIEWQFKKLNSGGFITRGSHPVGWCPNDGNPVGQHDTLGDVEPDIGEYTIIKFTFEDAKLVTATLRPETIFGVTNLWINPEIEYVKISLNDEKWIVSRDSMNKFEHLVSDKSSLEIISGDSLIGKWTENPFTDMKIQLLPASFVDSKNGTGLVMSVPSHAPYDYQAIVDFTLNLDLLSKYPTIDTNNLVPIDVIKTEKYNNTPARQLVSELSIKNQDDPKLVEATKELYNLEFTSGKMLVIAGDYADLPAKTAKDKVKNDLIQMGIATKLYEIMNSPVICRCGTECVIKMFEDQWFIDYGMSDWKEKAHSSIDSMSLLPNEITVEFHNTIDWLHEKACARNSGLGTILPWDNDWIIESLSDSVIYMAYYTISRLIKEKNLDSSKLSEEFFDYVLLGIGECNSVANTTGIDKTTVDELRSEFLYFYPLDSRHSGRDLVPNHLTFFVFNHSAIFPKNHWPQQIVVNGSVLMDGKKMSKSFGNIIPLRQAVKTYGADPIRLGIMSAAELLQDADFSLELVKSFNERLNRIYTVVQEIKNAPDYDVNQANSIEKWMLSRLQRTINVTTDSMNKLRVRESLHHIIYLLDIDLLWYNRRTTISTEEKNSFLKYFFETRIKLLAPFAPYFSEEIWEILGHDKSITLETWPTSDDNLIDENTELSEELIKNTIEDINNILKVTKIQIQRMCIYIPANWKWEIFLSALQKDSFNLKDLIETSLNNPDYSEFKKHIPKFCQSIFKEISNMDSYTKSRILKIGQLNENQILQELQSFYKLQNNIQVDLFSEDDSDLYDPKNRSIYSRPMRPAIFLE